MTTEKEVLEAKEALANHVPDSVRLKWALRKLGEQESYIDELEHTVKDLKQKQDVYLNGNDDIKKQIKREHLNAVKNAHIQELEKSLRKLRGEYEYLLSKLNSKS